MGVLTNPTMVIIPQYTSYRHVVRFKLTHATGQFYVNKARGGKLLALSVQVDIVNS